MTTEGPKACGHKCPGCWLIDLGSRGFYHHPFGCTWAILSPLAILGVVKVALDMGWL